ncbi:MULTISPECIES: peptide MFS transporter [Microbacterium]|uniref:peptide MFS transporter n=1 Tax=Microbacterium TaxID=33882 RepID=UPI0021A8405F|nr:MULTISPECIES: oligopeptide:H+ symporter [Microbacterium]MCT1365001.1 oligopeptide:H+ symporter [Microbacterium sp. p3-SID131]MCT1375815.1 oligopeptide:H+ symporter [Microbacterium sp. p3-SID337]MCZ0709961.1 oligopeptide:H+ symporter [Microbacterium paraoxydans]MDH5132372.1 oligopeptide:H+ symporter [Microbacterium sp. RD10]MDH5136994.1 oligopeptide:H+ symporter [Microbacterium sp. RD11]
MSTTAHPPASRDEDTRFFGQPWSLVHIFGVEMWERFSFYGMQGILLIYLYFSVTDGGLGLPEAVAGGIVGAYGGSVYLSTILGAWLADRLFGSERVLFVSAIVIVSGHLALALLPGFVGVGVGLVLVALGSGGLKANATSVVGTLYRPDDERRDAGFSLFYLGINLGAFLGPILTGLLQSTLGFHWGFGLAALGMTLGLVQYSFGRRGLPASSREVPNPLPRTRYPLVAGIAVGAVVVIAVLVLTGVIQADNLATIVIGVTVVAAVAYFAVILGSRRIDATERSRVWGFLPLFLTSVAFWSLYQQQFTVLTIYSDKRLDRDLFGWEMPVSWVQSINPVFIIILSGVFAAIWTKLGKRQPSTPVKFGLAAIIMGSAFLLFLPFSGGGANSTPLLAIVGILFVFTVAELLLSPVGLSVTTKLAPAVFHTQMVALFFLSIALGTAISGELVKFYDPGNEVPYFSILGGIAILVGIGLLLSVKPVLRLMRGVR